MSENEESREFFSVVEDGSSLEVCAFCSKQGTCAVLKLVTRLSKRTVDEKFHCAAFEEEKSQVHHEN